MYIYTWRPNVEHFRSVAARSAKCSNGWSAHKFNATINKYAYSDRHARPRRARLRLAAFRAFFRDLCLGSAERLRAAWLRFYPIPWNVRQHRVVLQIYSGTTHGSARRRCDVSRPRSLSRSFDNAVENNWETRRTRISTGVRLDAKEKIALSIFRSGGRANKYKLPSLLANE